MATCEDRGAPPDRSGATGSIFGVLWASAHVVHVWDKTAPEPFSSIHGPLLLAVLVSALLVLARPRSPHALALLALAQVTAFLVQFPLVANHWTIGAFVNAGILATYVGLLRSRVDLSRLVPGVATYARAVFLVSYSAAAIAKLNTTFLDPDHSCALATLEPVVTWVGLTPPGVGAARLSTIWIVVAIELAVPLLLILAPLRRVGIALAAVFHFALASTPVVLVGDFTLFVLALCLLFAPEALGSWLLKDLVRFCERRSALCHHLRKLRVPAGSLGIALTITFAIGREPLMSDAVRATATWGGFLLFASMAVTILLAVLLTNRATGSGRGMLGQGQPLSIIHWALVALLVLNAGSPYLGLKTTSSFTMFSNLRTEAPTSNHLFLPRVTLFSYQDDLVEIVASSDELLSRRVADGQFVTYHELRRQLRHTQPPPSATFVRHGEVHVAAPDSDEPAVPALAFWERKLLHFRPVSADGIPHCQP